MCRVCELRASDLVGWPKDVPSKPVVYAEEAGLPFGGGWRAPSADADRFARAHLDELVLVDGVGAGRQEMPGTEALEALGEIPGSSGTSASLAIGQSLTSAIDFSTDSDWVRVELAAGQSYRFALAAPAGGSSLDSTLTLRNASGSEVAYNDDSGSSLFSTIVHTPTTGGTFYLDVRGFSGSTGGYTLTATVAEALTVFTNDEIARQLTHGHWGGTSRAWNVSAGGRSIWVDYSSLSQSGQTLAREALNLWADITGIRFIVMPADSARLKFDDDEQGAFTETSYSSYIGITGAVVNVSSSWVGTYGSGLDSYTFQAYVHEIGHALGLGHPGSYDGSATYPGDALYLNDSWATSVMSYFDQRENGYFNERGFTVQHVATPMAADAIAAATLYGAWSDTRTGDTTYGFNNSSGRAVYDATRYSNISYTIYDHGGTDTLDYSGFSQAQKIDLQPENFSSVGGLVGNVVIGRGVVIENAIGGSGNDMIIGNGASNFLQGNGGDDDLTGGGGDDRLEGGAGSDSAIFNGVRASYNVTRLVDGQVQVSGPEGIDLLSGVERLHFADGTFPTPTGLFGQPAVVSNAFGAGAGAGGWSDDRTYPRTLADVNGDGRADIVGFGHGGVYVSLAAAGGFAPASLAKNSFGAGAEAGGWSDDNVYPRLLADVNGDSRADIVGFGYSGVYVALADGSGGFGQAYLATSNFGAGAEAGGWSDANTYPRLMADVNGDKRADIVGFGHSGVYVALGNASGGFGAMSLAKNAFGAGPEGGGWSNNNVYPRTLGDVNGDGKADLVGFGHAGVYVALADGSGGFADAVLAKSQFGAGAGAGGWSDDNVYPRMLADVNGDILADLIGFGHGGVHVALATGGGAFADPTLALKAFGAGAEAGGWSDANIYPRLLADVNGDGSADLIGFGHAGVSAALASDLTPIA